MIAKNKKAYFDYDIIEKYETGIVLNGPEVKSVKAGHVQPKGSFVGIIRGQKGELQLVTENLHISPYRYSTQNSDPMRRRQLLLRRKEIDYLAGLISKQGLTLVPLDIYLKKGLIKITLGVCRGRKAADKRQVLKRRAQEKEINQGLKRFGR